MTPPDPRPEGERIAILESGTDALYREFRDHRDEDKWAFAAINSKLDGLDTKLDDLIAIRNRMEGAAIGARVGFMVMAVVAGAFGPKIASALAALVSFK